MVLEATEAVVGRAIHKKGRPTALRLKEILLEQLVYEH